MSAGISVAEIATLLIGRTASATVPGPHKPRVRQPTVQLQAIACSRPPTTKTFTVFPEMCAVVVVVQVHCLRHPLCQCAQRARALPSASVLVTEVAHLVNAMANPKRRLLRHRASTRQVE